MMDVLLNRRTFLKTTLVGLTGLTIGCNIDFGDPELPDSEAVHEVTV